MDDTESPKVVIGPGKPFKDSLADIRTSTIFNYSVIYWNPPRPPLAADVVLHWCVKTYDVNVTDNVLSMELISSLTVVKTLPNETDLELGDFLLLNQSTSAHAKRTQFRIGGRETKQIRNALEYALVEYSSQLGYFENGADRLLYAMEEIERQLLPQKANVYGTAWLKQVNIEIRWEWLIFLAAQIVISIVILGLVIWETYEVNIDIIKSATIPALFAINSQEMARLEFRSRGKRTTLLEQYQFIDMLETPFGKPQEPHVSSAHYLAATWQNIALHKYATPQPQTFRFEIRPRSSSSSASTTHAA
ncbi:hypothetical protein K4K61_011480 [Colletotrichum sp. SAR11_59]|nr:hypothetical protein K4K61_011480 [Colletotrichum sp. SAR11_59]